ncbi:MAG TPA: hypothetical protein DCR65_02535 [Gammaproteobacteria bacterium]|jgi:Co/Zn/Cd efflux system component|nr:hypothetical protein [Gammaproteobacteria bacterium]
MTSAASIDALSSVFSVPGMDCPSEERLIRLALDPAPDVESVACDFTLRRVVVTHRGPAVDVLSRLEPLRLGAVLLETAAASALPPAHPLDERAERRVLIVVLVINAVMFVAEFAVGWFAQSSGLIADALDMLADAMVYGMALGVVGGALARQVRMAHLAAVLQALLAVGVLLDVLRRVWWGSAPMPELMMGMATLAMIANGVCLLVLARHRQDGAHMRATWIFTSTDALANAGVVVAGALVAWSGSEYPDLVMGAVIAIMVFQSARLIWRTAEAGSQTGR